MVDIKIRNNNGWLYAFAFLLIAFALFLIPQVKTSFSFYFNPPGIQLMGGKYKIDFYVDLRKDVIDWEEKAVEGRAPAKYLGYRYLDYRISRHSVVMFLKDIVLLLAGIYIGSTANWGRAIPVQKLRMNDVPAEVIGRIRKNGRNRIITIGANLSPGWFTSMFSRDSEASGQIEVEIPSQIEIVKKTETELPTLGGMPVGRDSAYMCAFERNGEFWVELYYHPDSNISFDKI